MVPLALVGHCWRWLKGWVWTLTDALPPYCKAEGPLETKETDSKGKFYIRVGGARVEVDRATFDWLVIGENLRVRYTKGNRAINIDRILPGKGPA